MRKKLVAQDVFRAIRLYASAYGRLEFLQRNDMLPIGDQKTGVIAEFYAGIYAERHFAKVEYGHSSQSAWDMKVSRTKMGKLEAVQVKAVSDFSRTRRVSPIHPGWDQLWLVCLNTKLEPYAFKIIYAGEVEWTASTLNNRVMPGGEEQKAGSVEFQAAKNKTSELLSAIRRKKLEWALGEDS